MAISTKSRFVSIDEDEDDKNICLLESNPANTERIFRCRHCSPMDNTYQLICTLKQIGDPDTKVICKEDCEHCPGFQSRYIQYPIAVQGINVLYNTEESESRLPIGTVVKVQPFADKYQNKTYTGIYLGELAMSVSVSYNEKTESLTVVDMPNSAIFVPALKKILWGAECRWEIKDDTSRDPVDSGTESLWYSQLGKMMTE